MVVTLAGDVVELHDVRMAQAGRQPRFALEQADVARIAREVRREHRDGALLPQPEVQGSVVAAHAAPT